MKFVFWCYYGGFLRLKTLYGVRWSRINLMRSSLIWLILDVPRYYMGSWMWKQILKCQNTAASFIKVEIGDGRNTLFWYDRWSPLGNLMSLTRARGIIDMGISEVSSLHDVILTYRRRRHITMELNKIEDEIDAATQRYRDNTEDVYLWRGINLQGFRG